MFYAHNRYTTVEQGVSRVRAARWWHVDNNYRNVLQLFDSNISYIQLANQFHNKELHSVNNMVDVWLNGSGFFVTESGSIIFVQFVLIFILPGISRLNVNLY